jgi:hypothetical protein
VHLARPPVFLTYWALPQRWFGTLGRRQAISCDGRFIGLFMLLLCSFFVGGRWFWAGYFIRLSAASIYFTFLFAPLAKFTGAACCKPFTAPPAPLGRVTYFAFHFPEGIKFLLCDLWVQSKTLY